MQPLIDFAHQHISPTPTQQDALLALGSFLNSPQRCFLLKGYAGTGKTFLTRIIVQGYLQVQADCYRYERNLVRHLWFCQGWKYSRLGNPAHIQVIGEVTGTDSDDTETDIGAIGETGCDNFFDGENGNHLNTENYE
jgi:hypothetical protein